MEKALTLEEFTRENVPQSLVNLLEYFEKNNLDLGINDFLVGCIYILMLEYGFVPLEHKNDYQNCDFNNTRIKELSGQMPKNWKRDGLYVLPMVLPGHELYICNITCTTSCTDLLVNCVMRNIENCSLSMLMDTLHYFTRADIKKVQLTQVQNLQQLSVKFKNNIAFEAKHQILKSNDFFFSCLEDLPVEVILNLVKFLDVKYIVRLSATSKYFNGVLKDVFLWKNLLLRSYGIVAKDCDTYQEVLKLFMDAHRKYQLHQLKKHQLRIRLFNNVHNRRTVEY